MSRPMYNDSEDEIFVKMNGVDICICFYNSVLFQVLINYVAFPARR